MASMPINGSVILSVPKNCRGSQSVDDEALNRSAEILMRFCTCDG